MARNNQHRPFQKTKLTYSLQEHSCINFINLGIIMDKLIHFDWLYFSSSILLVTFIQYTFVLKVLWVLSIIYSWYICSLEYVSYMNEWMYLLSKGDNISPYTYNFLYFWFFESFLTLSLKVSSTIREKGGGLLAPSSPIENK